MQDTKERVEFLLILMEEKRAGLEKLLEVPGHSKEYEDLLLNKKAEYTYFVGALRAVLDPSKDIY